MTDTPSLKRLDRYRRALVAAVRSDRPDLTQRQMAVMLIVYLTEPPHTVRGLAAQLDVRKPVITRILDSLGRRDLLRRKPDEADRRNILVQRTVRGAVFLSEFSDLMAAAADSAGPADPDRPRHVA